MGHPATFLVKSRILDINSLVDTGNKKNTSCVRIGGKVFMRGGGGGAKDREKCEFRSNSFLFVCGLESRHVLPADVVRVSYQTQQQQQSKPKSRIPAGRPLGSRRSSQISTCPASPAPAVWHGVKGGRGSSVSRGSPVLYCKPILLAAYGTSRVGGGEREKRERQTDRDRERETERAPETEGREWGEKREKGEREERD